MLLKQTYKHTLVKSPEGHARYWVARREAMNKLAGNTKTPPEDRGVHR